MPQLTMPRLSDSMEEGVIVAWLVPDGGEVHVGTELVEIETDKATMGYESEFAGTLQITASPGDTVSVGDPIGAVLAPGEERPEPVAGNPSVREQPDSPADSAAAVASIPDTPARADGRVAASPIARRLAVKHDLDLRTLVGSGPGGRVVKRDVLAAAEAATSAEPVPSTQTTGSRSDATSGSVSTRSPAGADAARGEVTVQQPSRVQAMIARRMLEAKSSMPEFTLETEVDMEAAVALREQLKEIDAAVVPSLNDLVVRASALALRAHPSANGSFRDDHFETYGRVNVGVAVAVKGALVVPTVFDADSRTLGDIARETRRLAEAARAGQLTAAELDGGTFTVSNLGMFGINRFTAVLNPPQAAILAVGALERRPVVQGDEIVIGTRMALTLTCDHRILYGADAAAFLADIRANLEAPLRLAI